MQSGTLSLISTSPKKATRRRIFLSRTWIRLCIVAYRSPSILTGGILDIKIHLDVEMFDHCGRFQIPLKMSSTAYVGNSQRSQDVYVFRLPGRHAAGPLMDRVISWSPGRRTLDGLFLSWGHRLYNDLWPQLWVIGRMPALILNQDYV
jgi:hypothetical protein